MGKILDYVKRLRERGPQYKPGMSGDDIERIFLKWMERMETNDPKELSKIQAEIVQFSSSMRKQNVHVFSRFQLQLNMLHAGAIKKRTGVDVTIE